MTSDWSVDLGLGHSWSNILSKPCLEMVKAKSFGREGF